MIQPRTMLDVADNSGAKKAQCIRVMGGSNKRTASLGDIVIVAVKEAVPDGTVKKGEVARAVVVRTVKEVGRRDGSYIRFDRNAVVLLKGRFLETAPNAPATGDTHYIATALTATF